MIELTKNNYFTVSGTADTFKCHFDPLPKTFDNLYVESCRAAEEIYANRQGPLHLFYSGGIDSEFMLSVFLSLGIDVTPVILQLQPHYNDHDTDYAFKYCKDNDLAPMIIDLDFDQFVNSGKIVEYAVKYRSDKYHNSALMFAIEHVDGTILCGGCEPYIKKTADSKWIFEFSEYEWCFSRLFVEQGIAGTPNFNCWTNEMNTSFLADPRMIDLAHNRVPGKLGSRSSKHIVYNRNNDFNLVERPKLHGYELIEKSPIFQHEAFKEIEKAGENYNGTWSIDYFDFMETVLNV